MAAQHSSAAIVTGASRGIGAAIAARLAADGYATIVNYSGSEAEALAVVEKIESRGGRAMAVRADVAEADAVASLFDEAEREFGVVDVLVNNAGIMRLSPLADAEDSAFDEMVAVNLRGPFNAMRLGARRVRAGGRIINLSTSVIGLAQPSYGLYVATKAGVEAMTRVFANELRGRNVTVNAVAPGPTATELFLDRKAPELVERLAKLAPLERLGEPADIAAAVAFLAGPDGGWINGQVLRANGGMV